MRLAIAAYLLATLAVAQRPSAPARRVPAELITVDDGLPQGMVWAILQDRSGFLWFATKDGLDRFDGYEHVVHRHDPEDSSTISESHVTSLMQDKRGRIWIGTDSKGVDVLDPATGRFTHVPVSAEDQTVPTVVHIAEHPSGDIWIHCFFGTVFIVPADAAAMNGAPRLLRLGDVHGEVSTAGLRDMEIAANGDVWLLGKQHLSVLSWVHGRMTERITVPIHWPHDDNSFFPELVTNDGADRILLSWDHRIVVFNAADRSATDTILIEQMQSRESRLFLDNKDRLWGLTGQGSWFRTDLRDRTTTFLQPVLENGRILSLAWFASWAMDRMGILWCGTTGHGLVKYDPLAERFHRWSDDTGEVGCTEIVSCDLGGRMLVNADEFKVLNDTVQPLRSTGLAEALANHGLQADWKRCVRDPQGRFWFCGIRRGASNVRHLYRHDPADGSVTPMTKGPDDYFINLFPGVGDTIWVCTADRTTDKDTALSAFDTRTGERLAHFMLPAPVKGSTRRGISSWQVAPGGSIWMGSDLGVLSLRPSTGEWRRFTVVPGDPTSLPSNVVFALHLDPEAPERYIWVGTAGSGLAKMDMTTGQCERFSMADGLPNNVIYGILSDRRGHLWISTNRGLCRFDPRTGTTRTYSSSDGIAGNEFNRYSAERSADGLMFFGGMEGITWFDPERFHGTEEPSPTLISGLRLMNKRVSEASHPDVLDRPVHLSSSIALPYDERMLTFEFSCMDLSDPMRNTFRYRLVGLSDEWVESGTERTATFTNLDPGRYTFQVQGRNSKGVWDRDGASLRVEIDAPWWGTWWFRIATALAALAAVYSIYRYRLDRAVEVVHVRERIARDLHDEIGSTLSSVSLLSTVAQRKVGGRAPEASDLLGRITESTTQVMEVMNDIVWAVNADNDDMASVVKRMMAFAVGVTEARECVLSFQAEEDLKTWRLGMAQRKNLYLIFKEAVNNAVKYSGCAHLRIELSRDGRCIVLRVNDDGVGFDPGSNGHSPGGGNGLINMRQRAAELPGTLTITSAAGQGTTVELRFDPTSGRRSLEPMRQDGQPVG
ncbi:MAG TPA: two-component regulator propeller domain-containing protein [Flavobacteriales bacterium]|nr:two-component regulator propeller domain-containing protein [Flavobacteriales bacterium]HMR27909.1 two-component regulator propeller domain-containing protein [Flavobacteriales bacterium]